MCRSNAVEMSDLDRQRPNGRGMYVSKQFQPKKYKDIGQEWCRTEPSSQSVFIPFKSNSISRSTTPLAPISEQNSTTGSPQRSNKSHPFEYHNETASYNNLCQVQDLPKSHSTPKVAHHPQIRSESAIPMSREQKLTWGRLPPSASYRSSSAMAQPIRPLSRQSDVGIGGGHCSHYQSYCTLPRPEEVDGGTLNDMHSNLHAFHSNTIPKVVSRMPPTTTMVPTIPSMIKSDSMHAPSLIAPSNPVQSTPPILLKQKEVISWNTLSLLCSMQVLSSLTIFGIGIGRMLQGAKWGIGIELGYAFTVLTVGLVGICAVRQRSNAAATFVFCLNAFCFILAIPPFVIGLFPAIPWAFAEATPSLWTNAREPLELDFGLSLIVLIQVRYYIDYEMNCYSIKSY
ncbi:hypothetical protein DICVIV_00391 [Dictyocaulus viviparus]|uniref:Uncharacterized protein n=1 Tax=Dictyocaulus viviparus TaxID=29172 RepID=A0A0D8Y9D5_DICVI|nr:hypothetical protein DICVIV_00391 [Dictyocaulus viviparus]